MGGPMTETASRERRMLKLILSPRSECVSTMQLALPDVAALAHIAACPRCQAERALLAEFESIKPEPEEEAKVTWISQRLEMRLSANRPAPLPEPRWRRWLNFHSLGTFGFAMAAAVLVVAVSAGFFERRQPGLVEPRGELAMRSEEIAVIAPLGDLDGAPLALQWQPVAGAASYEVRVTEVDRTPVFVGQTITASSALPSGLVVPGKPLLWQVVAKDAAGHTLAQSAPQRFRLKQP
jgi:hypothetical protein